jgi:16S rRNA (guanine527-N7)-methyltransferase
MSIAHRQIDEALRVYGIEPQRGLAEKISAYMDLLLRWNRKIALTTVTDPAEIVRFHFGESLFAASRYNLANSRLADVGAGAGFPGLPLALAVPNVSLTLIESNLKKCVFLAEVIRQLAVPNASVFSGRMESFGPDATRYDFIAARAFGQFDELLDWGRRHLVGDGKMLLWLGEEDSTKISSQPGWSWEAPAPIPGSMRRYILGGSPQGAKL